MAATFSERHNHRMSADSKTVPRLGFGTTIPATEWGKILYFTKNDDDDDNNMFNSKWTFWGLGVGHNEFKTVIWRLILHLRIYR
jgi:hypothetical protein